MESNPFSALTLIGAPALLTNACAVLLLSTANRFGRTVDRARMLSGEARMLSGEIAAQEEAGRKPSASRMRQLAVVERRMLLIARALAAFYLAFGSFAAGTLASLVGAISAPSGGNGLSDLILGATLAADGLGFVGLVFGAATLVWETRLAFVTLREEADQIRARCELLP
jgi:hypothetical protein